MKKFIIFCFMFVLALPASAVCSITGGACTATTSNWETQSLEQRLVPDNLQKLQKTDAFQRDYRKPYYDELINTEEDNTSAAKPQTNEYNSNCQFGVCLPGVEPGEDVLE